MFYFSFMTVGLTVKSLLRLYKRHGLCNAFLILPVVSLVATILHILLVNANYLVQNSPLAITVFPVISFVLDWFGVVPLDVAYFLRLRLMLATDITTKDNKNLLNYGLLLFLVMPCFWIVVDIVGILSTYETVYTELVSITFGIGNVGLCINDVLMHVIFMQRIFAYLETRKTPGITKLKILTIFSMCNSVVLLIGGIVGFFNRQIGMAIAFSSWLVNIWVFLTLNEIIIKLTMVPGIVSITLPEAVIT